MNGNGLSEKKQIHLLLSVYLVFIIIIGAGFFLPFSETHWMGFTIKGILFLLVSCVVYYFMFNTSDFLKISRKLSKEQKNDSKEIPVIELYDTNEWPGFNNSFKYYYKEFFKVVSDSLVTTCIGLYMGNEDTKLHFYSGEDADGLLEGPGEVKSGNIIDQTFSRNEPLLEGNLPIGSTLSGFEDCEIRSAISVPLVLNNKIVGVLAVGNTTVEHFSIDDIPIMVKFGNLIAQVMAICYTGIKWETDRKVYQVHLEFEKALQLCYTSDEILELFISQIRKLFAIDRFTLCRKKGNEGVVNYVYGQIDDIDRGASFSLDDGLCGWVIKRCTPLIIEDIEEGRFIRPRYYKGEDVKHGLHSFLCIPLTDFSGEVWGCISLENRLAKQYDHKSKEILSFLTIPLKTRLQNLNRE